jgi:hypothetical protein
MTARTEHTPGPWTYDREDSIIIGTPRLLVADLDPEGVIMEYAPVAQVEANGRLIASAPALLAACEALQTATVVLSNHALAGSDYDSNAVLSALAVARAAIAKARGNK